MTETATSQDIPASSRMAMMMPPMDMIGAATVVEHHHVGAIWTCWTSLVPRVMRVAVPKLLMSSAGSG